MTAFLYPLNYLLKPKGRPERFRITSKKHWMKDGAALLGLGQNPWTPRFQDDSKFENHGTLTNMSFPPTATSGWGWDNTLKRPVLGHGPTYTTIEYVTCGTGLIVNPDAAVSVHLWLKYRNANWATANQRVFISRLDANNCLQICGDGNSDTNNTTPVFTVSVKKAGAETVYHSAQVAIDTWYSLLFTWNGSSGILYLNGVPSSSAIGSTGFGVGTTSNLCLGARYTDSGTGFRGFSSDLGIWNRVIPESMATRLADPAWSIDYGGLIEPIWPRVFAAAVAPSGNNYSDSCSASATAAVVPADTSARKDALVAAATASVVPADVQARTEALSVAANASVSPADAQAHSEALTAAATASVIPEDTSAQRDALSASAFASIAPADHAAFVDACSASANASVVGADTQASIDTEFAVASASVSLHESSVCDRLIAAALGTVDISESFAHEGEYTDTCSAKGSASIVATDRLAAVDVLQTSATASLVQADHAALSDSLSVHALSTVTIREPGRGSPIWYYLGV
jgi:hypothetical protein